MEFAIRYKGWISSLQALQLTAWLRIFFWEVARLRRHEGEHENRARFCNSSKHAHRDTRTYQSEGQFVQIRESGGGMASSHWGMYSRLPTLRVLTLRLRDVQFWLPIRNDGSISFSGE